MLKMKYLRVILFAAAVLLPVTAQAGPLALDLVSAGSAMPCGSCGESGSTFGWAFHVNETVTVTGIGLWDDSWDGNGIGARSQVGLWTSGGALLGSAVVSDGSAPVASALASGRWLFEDLSLTLTSGDYLIGGVFYGAQPIAQVSPAYATDPRINVTGAVHSADYVGFAAPTQSFDLFIAGPTFSVASSETPEPAAFLLAGFGLLAVGLRRRFRNA
jgi:MYXO-CTERM domain-containing protein